MPKCDFFSSQIVHPPSPRTMLFIQGPTAGSTRYGGRDSQRPFRGTSVQSRRAGNEGWNSFQAQLTSPQELNSTGASVAKRENQRKETAGLKEHARGGPGKYYRTINYSPRPTPDVGSWQCSSHSTGQGGGGGLVSHIYHVCAALYLMLKLFNSLCL